MEKLQASKFKLENLKIGKSTIKPPLVLAPMEGVNDSAFRSLCIKHGAGATWSEMISAESLLRNSPGAIARAKRLNNDKPRAIQLFGTQPKRIAEAAVLIESEGLAEIIDLNAGCPAPNITQMGAGAALLRKPKLIVQIVEALTETVSLPISVKVRCGWEKADAKRFLTTIKAIEKAGASAITVHPRTATQGYSGNADWSFIAKAKQVLEIPVIGNGDVRTPADAMRMLTETNCDAVMIGREAAARPQIFEDIVCAAKGKPAKEKSWKTTAKLFEEYLKLAAQAEGTVQIQYAKIHAQSFSHGLAGSAQVRQELSKAKSIEALVEIFNRVKSNE